MLRTFFQFYLSRKNTFSIEEKTDMFGLEEVDGCLAMKPVKLKFKAALSFCDLTSGFHVYISVCLSKYPGELQGMLSYMEKIREAVHDNPHSSS